MVAVAQRGGAAAASAYGIWRYQRIAPPLNNIAIRRASLVALGYRRCAGVIVSAV